MRLLRLAPGLDRAQWSSLLASLGPAPAANFAPLKQEDADWVALAPHPHPPPHAGDHIVIKHRRLRGPIDTLRSHLRRGRLARQWRGAATLAGLGFPTPRPLALALIRGWGVGGGGGEVLALESARGESLLKLMAGQTARPRSARHQHLLAARLGHLIADITARGWYNRDFKPSNILIAGDPDDPVIIQIDTVAIRRTHSRTGFSGPARGEAPRRMLRSLVIEPTGCDCRPRSALLMCALTAYTEQALAELPPPLIRAARHALWRMLADEIDRHGDPTPRTPPI